MAATERGRVARYSTSPTHMMGCTLALAGPALALAGVVAAPVGLALVPALYAVGAFLTRARPHASVVADLDPEDVRRSLEQIQRRTRTGVPDRISLKVTTIATTINELLPRADALGAGSPGRHVLVNCATDYLPTALQAYLDRPRSYAHHHVVVDGKTPLDLLAEQLGVLAQQVDEIAENVNRAHSDKLIANGLFLAEKFGRGPLDIDRAAAG